MKRTYQIVSLILALLLLASAAGIFASCGLGENGPNNGTVNPDRETIEEDHRFDNVSYDGRPFRIYTSTNAASTGMGNSNFLIEGSGEIDGSLVNDAVLERNTLVQELLDIELEFTQVNLPYSEVAADIRLYTTAGTDEFDLVINDIYAFAELIIEGNFRNTLEDDCVFDFERPYWYGDYMEDLRFMNGYQYILAGDYFADVIRSAHLLLLNKDLYVDHFQSNPDELYDVVSNYEWTYDRMNQVISNVYLDSNNNGQKDKGDVYGFMEPEFWGGSIPFSVSGNPTFITRDEDGVPEVVVNQGERAGLLANAIADIFNNECSSIALTPETEVLQAFTEGQALIVGYQRLGSLENPVFRDMSGDAAVLPYPMLMESDKKYTTSAHDTTEMGAILSTSRDLAYISTVVEVLNRESANVLMPAYYREGLQLQLVDDERAAAMIDIIHDNFDNSFILAYNLTLGSTILQSFAEAASQEREFHAIYTDRTAGVVNKTLRSKINLFMKKNQMS